MTSLLAKIFTALRGGIREAGEAIVDKNSIRIFEQEIKDAETALAAAKQDLTQVMAQEMQTGRRVEALRADIEKHEGYVTQALQKGDEGLALEIAQKISELQSELTIQQNAQASFLAHVERLKEMIKQTSKGLADMQRRLIMVKTTENVQKATATITENYATGSSKLLTAKESLDRIEKRQQDTEDRMKAGELLKNEFDGKDLEKRLQEAGIVKSNDKAAEILAALKAKNQGQG